MFLDGLQVNEDLRKARQMDTRRLNRSISLAIATLDKRIKEIAFEANMHEKLGSQAPEAVSASKERTKLLEARETLMDLMLGGPC